MIGFFFFFVCALFSSLAIAAAGDRHPLYEPGAPDVAPANPRWKESEISGSSLHVAAVSDFVRLPFGQAPAEEMIRPALFLQGWRGERVSGQVAAWSSEPQGELSIRCDGLFHDDGRRLDVCVSMVRYTKAAGRMQADIIGREKECPMASPGVRPAWVEVNIPAHASPGVYRGEVRFHASSGAEGKIPVELTVEPELLPDPSRWRVHLDLWQHPQAVARWHDVEPWSPEHLALLKPQMQRLAQAGQKVITCSIIDEAWNGQTYDSYPSMIRWMKGRDGVMRYDYRDFDTWVSFMTDEVGIKGQISCYTMIPWSMKIRYFDEAADCCRDLELKPEDASYEKIWGAFLDDFRAHVAGKGWLNSMCIALDERPDSLLMAAKSVLKRHAPEFRIVSAVNAPSALSGEVDDLSPLLSHVETISPELLKRRKAEGKTTTFYVCMMPLKPNTYANSPLAEAEWLGFFAAANRLDGFLRWAYHSWNRNPFECTDYKAESNWSPGDCFLIYPGNLSSLRFEYLRDGLEAFEKINILRARAAKLGTPQAQIVINRLNGELASLFTVSRSRGSQHAEDVQRARELLLEAAKQLR